MIMSMAGVWMFLVSTPLAVLWYIRHFFCLRRGYNIEFQYIWGFPEIMIYFFRVGGVMDIVVDMFWLLSLTIFGGHFENQLLKSAPIQTQTFIYHDVCHLSSLLLIAKKYWHRPGWSQSNQDSQCFLLINSILKSSLKCTWIHVAET